MRSIDTLRAVLTCEGLTKSFGKCTVVESVDLGIAAGEAYGLLGPNGAGKTTTLRMICGLLKPSAGSIALDGGGLGYVPQDVALYPMLTLYENVLFWTKIARVPRQERHDRACWALSQVGLEARRGQRLENCSGGMQRRANLAVALVAEPSLLVLDEPTVGVDPQSRASLIETLGLLRDAGTALLYTSHYMAEVQQLCDTVGIIDHGSLIVEGTPGSLISQHGVSSLEELFLALTGRELRDDGAVA